MTGPLQGVLLVRFAHAYGRHGGVSHHLAAIAGPLTARQALHLVTLHPGSAPALKPAQRVLRRAQGMLLQWLHPPRWAHRTVGRLPVPTVYPADLCHLPALAQALRQLRKEFPERPALYVDHGPSRAYAPARLRLAREAGYATAIVHHGSLGGRACPKLRRAAALSHAAGAVTLRGHDGCLGQNPQMVGDGVDLQRFDPAGTARGSFRRQLGIDAERTLLLLVGRIMPAKGWLDLVAALAQCHEPHGLRGLTLAFAGTATDKVFLQRLQGALAALPMAADITVHWMGELPAAQLCHAYRDADLLVLPSHDEGLPRVVLEAQAMECAVVATQVGGTQDALLPGVTGLLVPPRDVRALADAIVQGLRGARAGTLGGPRARAHVEQHFALDLLVKRYEALCLRALQGAHAG